MHSGKCSWLLAFKYHPYLSQRVHICLKLLQFLRQQVNEKLLVQLVEIWLDLEPGNWSSLQVGQGRLLEMLKPILLGNNEILNRGWLVAQNFLRTLHQSVNLVFLKQWKELNNVLPCKITASVALSTS